MAHVIKFTTRIATCSWVYTLKLDQLLHVELSVSHGVAVEILKIIRGENMPRIIEMSALELLRKEQQQTQIVTFSATIDEMLGGGVHLGKITEFCGAPGIGKTQMR